MKKVFILLFFYLSCFLQAQNFAKAWEPIQKRIDKGESFSNEELNAFLKKHESDLEKNKIEKSIIYDYLGANAFQEEKYPEAIQLFEKAIAITKEINDTIYRAFYYYDLATLYNHVGYYTTAEPLFLKSLPTLSAVYGQSSMQYTMRFKVLAEMYVEMGKYNEAKLYNDALLYYFKTLNGEKDREYLICLNNDARISQGFGDYKKALETFSKLLAIHESLNPKDSADYITIINNTAEAYRHIYEYNDAIKLLNKALQLTKQFSKNDALTSATIYNNLGLCYKATGDYQLAESAFNNAISIYKSLKLDFVPDYTNPLSNKADLYTILGRNKEAGDLLQQVIYIRKNSIGTKHVNYANALSNFALVRIDDYKNSGITEYIKDAETYLLEAKNIYKEILGVYHPYYANCINNLSMLYTSTKRYKEALELKEKALDIMREMYGESNERYAYFLGGTVSLYEVQGNYKKAIENVEKANSIIKAKFGEKHIGYIDGIFNLAYLKFKTHDYKKAGELFIQSLTYYQKQFDDYFDGMSENDQLSFYGIMGDRFETFNSFLIKYTQEFPKEKHNDLLITCFNNQLFLKSMLLNRSIATRNSILNSNDTSLINTYRKWQSTKQQLAEIYRNKDFEGSYFTEAELQTQLNKLDEIIKQKTKLFEKEKTLTFKDIQNKLQTNEAALTIIRENIAINDSVGKTEYIGLLVKKSSVSPQLIRFENSDHFDTDYVEYYRNAIEEKKEDKLSYNRFWKPLADQLNGISHLYLSAEGVFNQINPYSLMNTANSKYVIDELSISNLPNLAYMLNTYKSNDYNSAELFGYPDYEFDFSKKTTQKFSGALAVNRFGFTELPPLPGTQTEISNISNTLKENKWKVSSFIKEKATEEQLKKVNSPKVLHIATHGFFLKDIDDLEDKSILGFESNHLKSNPLLRSGLMMAGASVVARDTVNIYKDQDGIFTAYEASLLNLNNTDLVILSACETGLGLTLNNQGVFGLQRSFYIAGAKNLIMSMWVVDDEATQILMSNFYKEWSPKPTQQNIALSFKKAQEQVRKQFPHPYYWSAFVLLGK